MSDNDQTSQAATSQRTSAPGKAANAIWTSDDELALVRFLADKKSEAGDGMLFQKKTWVEASQMMTGIQMVGGPKTADACKAKWGCVSSLFCIFWNTDHMICR